MEGKKQKSNIALREEEVLKFWQQNDTFNKSLTKDSPKGNYVFYDGPPFATGLPHYGHILGSTAKDVIGRYQTMQGYHVPRKWGWDCHGLPIENLVEKNLGISGKKGIEEYGIEKFIETARSSVMTYVHEWKKTVDRIGRWVDFDNSYKTMDNTFIESVWWALGEMNTKGLLYEGVRVLAYCPRCETPIANSEIAMDNSYKDITDISVYVKFRLLSEVVPSGIEGKGPSTGSGQGDMNTYLLAWTTTPWTLPGNTAIAVNKDIDYVFVKNGEEIIILAKERFENLKDKFNNPEILNEVKGSELVGLSYEPVFDYYKNVDMPNKENIWKVWHADFVTSEQGTGIAHEAPAFGEDDMNLAKANNIPFIRHVEPNGVFTKEVTDFMDTKAKPKDDPQSTDVLVIKYLASKGTLFAKEKIIHSYPHCYRCETPLLYYALPSWFVNIQKVKNDLLENAKSINWVPSHLKEGRFQNIMENAPDWTISRNRYWASPLPFWKSDNGKLMTVNSVDDLKNKTKKSGNKYFVVRHGQAEHNLKNFISFNEKEESHLTEKGEGEVKQVSEKIKDKNITKIIASPFIRALETARIIADNLKLDSAEIIIDARLGEFNPGVFNGKTWKERDDWALAQGDFYNTRPEGGESHMDAKRRYGDFMYEIESKYQNENILIVTHGIGIETLPAIVEGANLARAIEIYKIPHGTCEFMELNFIPLPHNANYELDLHRPYIDAIVLLDEDGNEYKRVPEVIDCWFESGSMPFAQDHYPFERPDWQEKNFPAGFVAEYIAQTRTWFYYTHAISTMLFNNPAFKNVVTTGTILAEDGSKMSKSKNNYPDPWILFDKYGVDALRFYLMSCPVMKGEDVSFSEKSVQDISSKIIGRLENVLAFYELYRDSNLENDKKIKSNNVLDKWIVSRLDEVIVEVTDGMESYDMALASRPFELFIEDLSTWYLRRSRDRLKEGDEEAKQTLYYVLKVTAILLAPISPFVTESIWQKLKNSSDEESVHLADWPKERKIDTEVLVQMQNTRDYCSAGNMLRKKLNIPVRQPLSEFFVPELPSSAYQDLIKEELNVKSVEKTDKEPYFNEEITAELKEEGNYRELVRAVQDSRKEIGLVPKDEIKLTLSPSVQNLAEKFMTDLKKIVGATEVIFAENTGAEFEIGDTKFNIGIEKN